MRRLILSTEMDEAKRLREMHDAISEEGVMHDLAYAIGLRREWKVRDDELGREDWVLTMVQWKANVLHKLDPHHPYQWTDMDRLDALRLIREARRARRQAA